MSVTEAEKTVAGYGAYFLWLIIAPERFGHPITSDKEMLEKHISAQRGLRQMFPDKPSARTDCFSKRRKIGTIYKPLRPLNCEQEISV